MKEDCNIYKLLIEELNLFCGEDHLSICFSKRVLVSEYQWCYDRMLGLKDKKFSPDMSHLINHGDIINQDQTNAPR